MDKLAKFSLLSLSYLGTFGISKRSKSINNNKWRVLSFNTIVRFTVTNRFVSRRAYFYYVITKAIPTGIFDSVQRNGSLVYCIGPNSQPFVTLLVNLPMVRNMHKNTACSTIDKLINGATKGCEYGLYIICARIARGVTVPVKMDNGYWGLDLHSYKRSVTILDGQFSHVYHLQLL